ncbi:MAG: ABC transporter ATP-binding protein [Acidobacteriota bacterium]
MLAAENIDVELSGRSVLRSVSCRLKNGEITAVLGANGAGKTTLLRALNGTISVSNGEINFDGRLLKDMSRREIARRIAVVAQENETKFPVTVFEYVLSGRFVRGGPFGWETADDNAAANTALADCNLADYSARMMNELSGGERQRVVLARALAAETDVLLLDEPTANLDLAHQALMFTLVRKRCRERGMTAAVITHDLNLASEFADKVLLLRDGSIYADGTPQKILTSENIFPVFGMNVLLDENPASGKVRVTTVF